MVRTLLTQMRSLRLWTGLPWCGAAEEVAAVAETPDPGASLPEAGETDGWRFLRGTRNGEARIYSLVDIAVVGFGRDGMLRGTELCTALKSDLEPMRRWRSGRLYIPVFED